MPFARPPRFRKAPCNGTRTLLTRLPPFRTQRVFQGNRPTRDALRGPGGAGFLSERVRRKRVVRAVRLDEQRASKRRADAQIAAPGEDVRAARRFRVAAARRALQIFCPWKARTPSSSTRSLCDTTRVRTESESLPSGREERTRAAPCPRSRTCVETRASTRHKHEDSNPTACSSTSTSEASVASPSSPRRNADAVASAPAEDLEAAVRREVEERVLGAQRGVPDESRSARAPGSRRARSRRTCPDLARLIEPGADPKADLEALTTFVRRDAAGTRGTRRRLGETGPPTAMCRDELRGRQRLGLVRERVQRIFFRRVVPSNAVPGDRLAERLTRPRPEADQAALLIRPSSSVTRTQNPGRSP